MCPAPGVVGGDALDEDGITTGDPQCGGELGVSPGGCAALAEHRTTAPLNLGAYPAGQLRPRPTNHHRTGGGSSWQPLWQPVQEAPADENHSSSSTTYPVFRMAATVRRSASAGPSAGLPPVGTWSMNPPATRRQNS